MAATRPPDEAVVFLFRFGHDGSSMVVTMADAERVLDTASKTRLCRRDPELLLEIFMENCGAGPESSPRSVWMTKGDFDASIRELVPAKWIPEEDKQRLSQVLSAVFYAFEEAPGKGVCVAEIVGGLSLLCAGNKSSKLAFAFHLFAVHTDEGGCLTPKLLGNFLGSFATVLCACTEEGMEMAPEMLRSVISTASETAVTSLLDTLDAATEAEISFEDVGNWYNTGGFEVIPWLELLDLRKWAATTGLEGPSAPALDKSGDDETQAAAAGGEGGEAEGWGGAMEDNVAFQFSLGPAKTAVVLTITEEDVSNVLELAQGTGLANKDPADVAAALLAASENTKAKKVNKAAGGGGVARRGMLSKNAFDHCIRGLVPGRRLSQGQKERFSGLLSAVFFAFDFDGSASADARDLASGFFLLCSGNKSVKLASAFRLLDEDGDDQLTREGVWRFLRSLLSILMGFSGACQAKSQAKVVEDVDSIAAWSSNLIFQSPNLVMRDSLSFDELAAWYTQEGYKVAPWLELLDLNKWAVGATGNAPGGGRSGGNGPQMRQHAQPKTMVPPGKPLIAEPKPPTPAAAAAAAERGDNNGSGGVGVGGGGGAPAAVNSASAAGRNVGSAGAAAAAQAAGGGGGEAAAGQSALTAYGAAAGTKGAAAAAQAAAAAAGMKESNGLNERPAGGEGAGEFDGGSNPTSQVLFTFPLVPDVELLVMQEDVDFVQRIVVGTRLAALLPQDILETFRDKATSGPRGKEVTKEAFDTGMQELVRLQSMLEDERDLLSFALANIFFAYDRMQEGRVLLRDLACGLSFLCCGSKSSKLAFAYSLFGGGGRSPQEGEAGGRQERATSRDGTGSSADGGGGAGWGEGGFDAEGEVSREAIGAFVSGLLTVLCSCVGQMLELTNREMWAIVDRSSEFTLEALFEDPESVYRGRTNLTFEEFGLWYNEGGFKSVPWMELVDLSKWVPGVGALRPVMEGPLGNNGAEMDKKPRFCFQISESANPVHLVISDDDATAVLDLVNKTGLCNREPADVCGTLVSVAKDGVLSKAAFDKCIRGMVPASLLDTEEKTSFSVLLSSIFFSFDRDNTSSADAIELASGFSLLCAGSKSAKLAFAFGLHDEDGDERLTRRGLWRYTRSFLTALMALSFASSSLSAEELTRAVDDGAVWTSAAIFAETATQTPNRIGFDEFAAWYTEGGFRVSPWLELLDMGKWVVPSNALPPAAAAPAAGAVGGASE
ncbi:conserved unknown protein [Ectocarpus siliculosus]|uniref:Calmodulin n=1 Tax=Ectocarpus siliculosus TaxID=2880 RepID=D7FUX5_ECTSI|nr:conserved unknown protein [Ectocarpus siliculosus]|eukprot:CBJ31781.1 conserved unknown protein [Ectocarpus siliculosus]